MLHNIFDRIAIEKVLSFCNLIEDTFYPQDLLMDSLNGYVSLYDPSYLCRYWLFGHKLALISIFYLRRLELLKEYPCHDFLMDKLSFAVLPSEENGYSDFDDLPFMSSESNPELGGSLLNVDMTWYDLFLQIGWSIEERTIRFSSKADPNSYYEEVIRAATYSRGMVVTEEVDSLLEWTEGELSIAADTEYLFLRFYTENYYSLDMLKHIFEGCIRMGDVYYGIFDSHGGNVYVLTPVDCSDFFEVADEVSLSSLDPRTFLVALYYYGIPKTGLPDFQKGIL